LLYIKGKTWAWIKEKENVLQQGNCIREELSWQKILWLRI
jgi:hypothetical protein